MAIVMRDRPSPSPQSVTRVIHILEALCGTPEGLSLAELSRALGSPKSSVAALLRGLEEAGFVVAANGGWRLGHGAFGLGGALLAARQRLHSSDLIRDGMRRLAEKSGETVLLAVPDADGETHTYVDVVESRNAVRFAVSVGDRRPLYCTSSGRMMISAWARDKREAYLDRLVAEKMTNKTITTRDGLAKAIEAARSAGVAQTIDQAADGVTGTASLIYGASGEVIGTLVVAAPSARTEQRREALRDLVRAEAAIISRDLGYRPPPSEAA